MHRSDPEEKIHEWRAWIRTLIDEAISLAHYGRIFHEIMKMLQSNPDLPESSSVYVWLKNVYTAAAVATVRRLADEHPGGISLFRLIGELRGHRQVVTRSWFLSQHSVIPREFAERTFNGFAAAGEEFIDHATLRLDQIRVKSASRAVTNFADKYVAHRDERITLEKTLERAELTWGQLDSAIDNLIEILRRYELLILQEDLGDHVPVPQDDWRAIFRVPWLRS